MLRITEVCSAIKTLYFFGLTCLLIPFLYASGLTLFLANEINLILLKFIFPKYEFSKSKKIRTLIDTKKNAAIFHFLLEINGEYDFQKIKEHYLINLVEKRNKCGELKFPKLRKRLTTWWWQYAWNDDCSNFDINKHVVLNTATTFRGRNLSEANIQEFLSELVLKYIPVDISPWQVIVIPSVSKNKKESYFILVKVHHLLFAEEKNLFISDLLMLQGENPIKMFKDKMEDTKFKTLIESPKHIPNLWNQIYMTAVNRWNEFIYHYDPLESPDVDKKQKITCLSQLISILFITAVTILTDFLKGYSKTKNHIKYKFRYLMSLIGRETAKRNLTIEAVVDSLATSMNPINIFKNFVRYAWHFGVVIILLTPYYMIKEILALKDIICLGHTEYSDTLSGVVSIYLPLIYCALRELFDFICQLINAPRNSYDELFISRAKTKNFFHSKTFSGRKVIAFSKSICLDEIKSRANVIKENGEIDFILTCLSVSLKKYLENFAAEFGNAPEFINATCRSIKKGFFLQKFDKTSDIGGVLFLKLPLVEGKYKSDFEKVTNFMEKSRKKQFATYIISLAQTKYDILTRLMPEVLLKIFINYFSNNYPITITELYGSGEKAITIWGQEVKDFLFFRPPQSKTCLSLNIHRFGNKVRLAVMADTHLSPDHSKIVDFFESYINSSLI